MNLYITLIFLLYLVCAYANINFKAKFMGNWRVSGDSFVIHALSISHCMAICNKNATCDAVTFHDKISKCRIFKRCKPLLLMKKSTHHWFYAKRPPILSSGYHYENQSDTCLAVKNTKTSYEDVDNICASDRAYPAVLNTPKLLQLAGKILNEFNEKEAWINPPFKNYERFAHNKETERKPKVLLSEKNGIPIRECWIMRERIPEKISPCLMSTNRFTICQLPTY